MTLRQQYLVLVAKKAALAHARATLDLARQEIASARVRIELGIASQAEAGGRESVLAERQLEFDRAEEEYDRSRRSIGRLAGLPELADEDIAINISRPTPPAQQADAVVGETLRTEGKNTLLAQIAEMQVRETDLAYRNTRVRLLPKFNLGASHSLRNTTNANETAISQTGITQQTVEVIARWTIWDSWATRAARLDALAQRRAAQRRLQTTGEANVDEVLGQQKAVEFALRAMTFSDQREDSAQANVQRAQDDVAYGLTAASAVEQSRRDLLSAEAASASARATFYIQWSMLVSLAGADPLTNVGSSPSGHGR